MLLMSPNYNAMAVSSFRYYDKICLKCDIRHFSATVPLQLPNPFDPRARSVAEALLTDPGEQRPLEALCSAAGASKRTIERIFQRETCMSFGKWRQQLRMMHALRLLAAGEKVSNVALEAGYSTPGAFAARFHKLLGTTPGKYFK